MCNTRDSSHTVAVEIFHILLHYQCHLLSTGTDRHLLLPAHTSHTEADTQHRAGRLTGKHSDCTPPTHWAAVCDTAAPGLRPHPVHCKRPVRSVCLAKNNQHQPTHTWNMNYGRQKEREEERKRETFRSESDPVPRASFPKEDTTRPLH